MIRMFVVEKNAIRFATEKNGKIFIKYDWDESRNKMIKYFVVKF